MAISFQYSQLRLHSATEQSLAMVMSVDLLMVAKPHTTPSLNIPRCAYPPMRGESEKNRYALDFWLSYKVATKERCEKSKNVPKCEQRDSDGTAVLGIKKDKE